MVIDISLPDLTRTPLQLWHSQGILGESSLALLILGVSSNTAASKKDRPLATIHHNLALVLNRTFSATNVSPVPLALVASDQALLRQFTLDKRSPLAPSIPHLWDVKDTLRRQLSLQERFGIAPTQPALIVIDRAGWLRSVSKVETAGQLQFALKVLADVTPKLEVSLPAPDFVLPDMNGVPRRPVDLQGKKYLLLTFFPKCFTGTCSKQLESIRDSQVELAANDIEVWGVSVDPAEGDQGQRAFAKFLELPFPLLPDTGRHLSILYGAAQSPNQTASRMSVLIDKQGIVRWIDKQINPRTHGADVVAKVRELEAVTNRNRP